VARLKLTTANLARLSITLKANTRSASNYRRIQRFMLYFPLDSWLFARLLRRLLPRQEGYLVIIDRTEWHVGRTPINVLMPGIAARGIAFPILWQVRSKAWAGGAVQSITLPRAFLALIPTQKIRIRAVLADREFITQLWLDFLHQQHILS